MKSQPYIYSPGIEKTIYPGYRAKAISSQRRSRKTRIPLLLRLSFLLFIFTIPIESLNLTLNLGSVSIARLAGLGLFAVSLLYIKRCYSVLAAPIWCFAAYLAVFVVVSIASPTEHSGLPVRVFSFVQLIAFLWMAANVLRDESFSKTVMRTYAISAFLLTVAFYIGLPGFTEFVMTGSEGDRVSTIGANPNYLGMVLAIGVVILLGLALEKKFRAVGLICLMVPLLIMIVQTGSRASLVGLIAGCLCYVLGSGLSRKVIAGIFIGFALLTVGYFIWTDASMVDRWQRTAQGESAGRDLILVHTLAMIAERPLMGWGPLEYQSELRMRFSGYLTGEPQDSHNMILNLLLELGLVGATPFVIGMALCARAAWRARQGPLGVIPLAALLTLLVSLQFHGWPGSKPMWLVFGICAAVRRFSVRESSQPTKPELADPYVYSFSTARSGQSVVESQD